MCSNDYYASVGSMFYTIIQIIIHYSICGWLLKFYKCEYVFDEKRYFKYFLYLTYFYNKDCKSNATFEEVASPDINSYQSFLNYHDLSAISWPNSSNVALRTYNICSNHITFNTLWLITSINLLIGAFCNSNGSWAAILYFPWVIITLIILIYDIITTAWFASDISRTYGLRKWFEFIGGKEDPTILKMDLIYPPINTAMPSIFLVVVFGRIFILWFVNLCIFFRLLQASVNAYRETGESGILYCIPA
ncbi:hypothetical protein RN001_009971 [Aquatica leii]|uniref:Uncharacterized protein n=1 Tax=Aquatica leii TaxID=1421715 RepID=A0AAN7P095_9COLE|nr:hypothetical protein RN001_009971 [Aquatica leii]